MYGKMKKIKKPIDKPTNLCYIISNENLQHLPSKERR